MKVAVMLPVFGFLAALGFSSCQDKEEEYRAWRAASEQREQQRKQQPTQRAVQPSKPSVSEPPKTECWAAFDRSPEVEERMTQFIEDLVKAGLVKKHYLSIDSVARVVVTPLFMNLDFDDKKQFLLVIYGHYFSGCNDTEMIILVDSKSGKRIGTYGSRGLDME